MLHAVTSRIRCFALSLALALVTLVLALAPSSAFADAANDEANSFRYQNGQRIASIDDEGVGLLASAWSSTPKGYISSNGQIIENAMLKGMDVSVHQGNINWEAVKNSDIDYVVIRCGYGDDLSSQDDGYWQRNVSECERLGIPYGVYIYSYACSEEEARSELSHALRLLEGHSPSYPVYYDVEDSCIRNALGNDSSAYARLCRIFCEGIEAAGYKAGVYASLSWWNNYLTSSDFGRWERWVAQWNSSCTYRQTYGMWQCADDGRVSGVSGDVDINFLMKGACISLHPSDAPFSDVCYTAAWYFNSVASAKRLGIFHGHSDGSFGPGDQLTRAQVAAVMKNCFDPNSSYSSENQTGMGDVDSNSWYTAAANWAVSNGIIKGKDGGRYFAPNDVVTREQLCVIVANAAARYAGADVENVSWSSLGRVVDGGDVSNWAKNGVAWCLENGIINGESRDGNRYANPQGEVNRAVAATLFVNAVRSGKVGSAIG